MQKSSKAPAEAVDSKALRKATVAGFVGTIVEWFDFAIYGFMAPYIAQTFFKADDPVINLLQTFAVFAVAFALRPLGGAFFGMLGDRIGRKRVLIVTVLIMSGSTAVIGILPGYDQIGLWAAVLLTVARCAQGLSAGGEYAGAVTFVIEHAPTDQRARWGSAMPTATFFAFAVAASMSFALSALLEEEAMSSWGWRIPFLIAAPLGLIAFWVRRRISETPMFKEVQESTRAAEHAPIQATLREQIHPMLIVGGYISLTGLSFYIFSTYMTTFLREVVGLDTTSVLLSNVLALACAAALAPFVGIICDRIGRRTTMFASSILLAATAVPGYLVASSDGFIGALMGQLMIMVGTVTANVVTAVLLTEAFPTRVRYTASAITYNVSYAVFGGTAPFVATLLIDLTASNIAPAVYLTVIALGAFVATTLLPETSGRELGEGLDEAAITARCPESWTREAHSSGSPEADLNGEVGSGRIGH